MSSRFRKSAARLSTLIAAVLLGAAPVQAIDWAKVQGKDIVLLYPGALSWEMLLTQKEHSGADKFRGGKDCRQCHEHHEHESGALMVVDKSAEPTPIPGKPGFLKAVVKVAHDAERFYVRVDFDPGKQPDAGMDKDHALKVAVMLDDGHVAEIARGGCWATCHDNLATMPSGASGDVTKYLARSRVKIARTGGDQIKPDADVARMRANGEYLEYWQARIKPDGSVVAVDGDVLDKRQEHKTPAVTATATPTGSAWSVVLSRKLVAGVPYKDLIAGKTYNLGLSIHAGHAARRFHYVSLEKTLVLDQGAADFVAVRN